MFRNFLWDNGRESRRHWVNWGTLCSPLRSGGLGIKSIYQVMLALQGKLAWSFLENKSLWAIHARSRYIIGRKGSCLWNNISPLITSIAQNCRWVIGNGDTMGSIFCQNLGLPCPKTFKSKSMKEILLDPNLKRRFTHCMNPRILVSIGGFTNPTRDEDRLVWEKDCSGQVTTSNFSKSFNQEAPIIKKFDILWHIWLPPKISCFLWRVLRYALPTHDNVMKIGIPLVSKCVCCTESGVETMQHLFVESDMASTIFNTLCPLFGKSKPQSFYHIIYHWGIEADLSSYVDCLGFGLICCCLWEIWKFRNNSIYGDHAGSFTKSIILKWSSYLSTIIGAPRSNMKDQIIETLRINPGRGLKHKDKWLSWQPNARGNTLNFFIFIDTNISKLAGIIRDRQGVFVAAFKTVSHAKHYFKCLHHLLSELQCYKQQFCCIKSSNEEICSLGREFMCNWSVFSIKRRIRSSIKDKDTFQVPIALNRPAEVLCFNEENSLFTTNIKDLPYPAYKAIINDQYLQPITQKELRVFL